MKPVKNTKQIFRQRLALAMAVIMLAETMSPTLTWALTSGPAAPEFSSFEPVSTTNMVNEFSGDFTYNIPVINIPGASGGDYALSLSYHSGESLETEASWVGYGWTLNPGAINRGKRGFADDTKNNIVHYNDVPANWTVSVGASAGNLEAFSFNVPLSANASIRYNNYRGFGYTVGAGISFRQGLVSLGYSLSDGSGSFSAQVNPAALLSSKKDKEEQEAKNKKYKDGDQKTKDEMLAKKTAGKKALTKKGRASSAASSSFLSGMSGKYGMYALSDQQHATNVTSYSGQSFNINFNMQTNPTPFEVGPQFGFTGNYNTQKNLASETKTAYGYLYSEEAYTNTAGLMDYYLDKESTYNKRDRYLSIPFSNADNFSVSGEGLGGGFRLYSTKPGHFRPNTASSTTTIGQVSADISLGLEFGGGFNLGLGQQSLSVNGGAWGNYGSTNIYDAAFKFKGGKDINEPYFFRFSEDMGGTVDYDASNKLVSASLNEWSTVPGAKSYTPQLSTTDILPLQSSIDMDGGTVNRSGRSSYIGYHTNAEITTMANGKKALAYEKSVDSDLLLNDAFTPAGTIDRSTTEQIGEIATTNEEGNNYVYGIPVYVGNETNLSYDLRGVSSSNIINNFIAFKNTAGSYKMKTGQVEPGRYASSYLLTQITSPDYVDRTMNGLSSDDFGGYTRFQYNQKNKLGTNPYHYRMPYCGLNYSKGEMTDPLDDMGSYNSGDKDVYLLKQIVTKTHIARFFTSDRHDGIDAAADDLAAADNTETTQGTNKLAKLDRIELWTNNNGAPGKLVKKVIFKYDYTLCSGVLNNDKTIAGQTGKLTLKELWFEYEGVVKAKISPYKFDYNYPNSTTAPYPTKYAAFQTAYGDNTALIQNPSYNKFAIDAWGNYQEAVNAADRFNKMQPGVDQTPAANFDPAAWQLKRITLPSGGEIHVQYEQDDYLYVQNRRAMELVSVTKPSSAAQIAKTGLDVSNEISLLHPPYSFILNVDEIGVAVGDASGRQALVQQMNNTLSGEKVYFKFLYALMGLNPDIGKCNSDYVSGYVNFRNAYVSDAGDVVIQFGDPNSSEYSFPREVCLDLVKKQKGGKLNPLGDCNASADGIQEGETVKSIAMQLVSKIGASMFAQETCCLEINQSLSYFKIPVLKAKKGGGLRVKRVLMYDANGIDTGVPALYGTEYLYQTETGESSGVATNEPAVVRDANALISFLPKRMEQGFLNKAVAGIDREQFEGPVGESLLPGASVGYSRVVAKNIHSGKTNTGFVVSEFNTVKDYPFDMNYFNGATKGIDNTDITTKKDWMNLPAVVANYSVSNVWTTQGFRFILNSMHGQPKSVSTFAGNYSSGSLTGLVKSSSTEYDYFQPGESVNVQRPDGSIVSANPGKDMEVVFEVKQVEDITTDASIEVDFGVGIAGIIPLPQASLSPLVNYTESKMRTHVTSKVIRYPVIQKSVKSSQDGIVHKTENLVFSAYTGKPLISRTTDGYDQLNLPSDNAHNGAYTSYTTPAYSQYAAMGQKAINERAYLSGTALAGVTFNTSGGYNLVFDANNSNACGALKIFTAGDLIKVNSTYFHVDKITGNTVSLLLTANLNSTNAVSTVSSIEIIESGRTNQLSTPAGSYTTYGLSTPGSLIVSNDANLQALLTQLNTNIPSSTSLSTLYFMCDGKTRNPIRMTFVSPNILIETGSTTSPDCSCSVPYSSTGQFYIDYSANSVKYRPSSTSCIAYEVPCLPVCNSLPTGTKVIASSATTFYSYWPYDASKYTSITSASYNGYEDGTKGKWRPKENYVYKEAIVGGATGAERNYKDAGTYTMVPFNWKNNSQNDATKWVKTNTVTQYSPNGDALEEQDALGIYSSAKFGYNNVVPYMVAQNSAAGTVLFESFENMYNANTKLEDGVSASYINVDNSRSHSGAKSYYLLSATTLNLNPVTVNSQILNNGISFKVWVNDPAHNIMPVKGTFGSITLAFKKIAQTGEWTLYEAIVNSGLTLNSVYTPQLKSNLSSGTIWIDDVRQQPVDAKVNAYVYDPATLKLLTSFDDQHFGLYYQYNKEGKLVRKLVETEKGMKTITETQYNSPAATRTPGLY